MLIKFNTMQKQKGIGLLELMLSLAIISVLLVMATRYYKSARQNQQVNDAISLSQAIIAASENWVIGKNDFTGISVTELINKGYLPRGSDKDPWHSPTVVTIGSNSNQLKITMQGLPVEACRSLAEKLNNQTAEPSANPDSMCAGSPATFNATF